MALFARASREQLVGLAQELGLDVDLNGSKVYLRKLIVDMDGYEVELVESSLEIVIEKEKEENHRKLELDRETRAHDRALVKEEAERKHELDRLKITREGNAAPRINEVVGGRKVPDIRKLVPTFNVQETDVGLFLLILERQLRAMQVEESLWTSQLLAALPFEVSHIILQESGNDIPGYAQAKQILLDRYRLTPEAFRQKFVNHTRKGTERWRDFAHELQGYLEGWLSGLNITTFEQLKELMIADQVKRKSGPDARAQFVDIWGEVTSPWELAEKLDKFELVRPGLKKMNAPAKEPWRSAKVPDQRSNRPEIKKWEGFKNKPRPESPNSKIREPGDTEEKKKIKDGEVFEKKKVPLCYRCKSDQHLLYNCPYKASDKRVPEKVNRVRTAEEIEESFAPYVSDAVVNGHSVKLLRDSGSTIDLVSQEYVSLSDFTGETTWLSQPLSHSTYMLPIAKIVLEGKFGTVITKAAVVDRSLKQDKYLMGNQTANLIRQIEEGNSQISNSKPSESQNSEKRLGMEKIQALTRSQARKEKQNPPLTGGARTAEEIDDVQAFAARETQTEETDESLPTAENDTIGLSLLTISPDAFREAQRSCSTLAPLFDKITDPSEVNKKDFCLENGLLVKTQKSKLGDQRKLLVIPHRFREEILRICHDLTASHLGVHKSRDRMARHFYWPGCYRDVEDFVKSCENCQRAGKAGDKVKAPMKLVPIIREIFSVINAEGMHTKY